MLEKKPLEIYKLKLLENLEVHPIFHVSFFKWVAFYASRFDWEHKSRPLLNLIDNELDFEMEVVFKSTQLQGHEQDCFVKWKYYHPIEGYLANKSNMDLAQLKP
jgi:hypothetical protein